MYIEGDSIIRLKGRCYSTINSYLNTYSIYVDESNSILQYRISETLGCSIFFVVHLVNPSIKTVKSINKLMKRKTRNVDDRKFRCIIRYDIENDYFGAFFLEDCDLSRGSLKYFIGRSKNLRKFSTHRK